MKYNFTKVEIKDIEGKKVEGQEFHKLLANMLYANTKDLDLVEKARTINKGEDVELDKTELQEVTRVAEDVDQQGRHALTAFARKAYKDYVDSVKEK